jgi:hypothetical protein
MLYCQDGPTQGAQRANRLSPPRRRGAHRRGGRLGGALRPARCRRGRHDNAGGLQPVRFERWPHRCARRARLQPARCGDQGVADDSRPGVRPRRGGGGRLPPLRAGASGAVPDRGAAGRRLVQAVRAVPPCPGGRPGGPAGQDCAARCGGAAGGNAASRTPSPSSMRCAKDSPPSSSASRSRAATRSGSGETGSLPSWRAGTQSVPAQMGTHAEKVVGNTIGRGFADCIRAKTASFGRVWRTLYPVSHCLGRILPARGISQTVSENGPLPSVLSPFLFVEEPSRIGVRIFSWGLL